MKEYYNSAKEETQFIKCFLSSQSDIKKTDFIKFLNDNYKDGVIFRDGFHILLSYDKTFDILKDLVKNFDNKELVKIKLNIIFKKFSHICRDMYYLIDNYCYMLVMKSNIEMSYMEKVLVGSINKNYIFYDDVIPGWLN